MKLYHGTTEQAARLIIKNGLKPRSAHRQSNWKHTVESNRHAVYLTDTYPLYFAVHAGSDIPSVAIIEIETDRLVSSSLVPDEDALAFANRDKLPTDWSIQRRARYFRSRLKEYEGRHADSLNITGTCAHIGRIPPTAITRVAIIDCIKTAAVCWMAANASISPMNFKLLSVEHKAIIRWVFNEPLPDLSEEERLWRGQAWDNLQRATWTGIEILDHGGSATYHDGLP